jgi:hypothetical protein
VFEFKVKRSDHNWVIATQEMIIFRNKLNAMSTPTSLLNLHKKYAQIFAPTPTELLAWNVLGDRPTEKVVTKTGLF